MQKIGRIEADIKYHLSKIISEELRNPNLTGIITITAVKTSKDLDIAKVYVSIFESSDEQETFEQLKNSRGYIRKSLASKLKIRNTPEIIFELDNSMEYGSHMDKIIKELNIPKETEEDKEN